MPAGSGPAKTSENTKIQRRAPALTDDFFFGAPGTGVGGISAIAGLLSLLGTAGPVSYYPTTSDQLDNTTIQPNYFAFVGNAEDDPDVDVETWAIYLYRGGDRDDIASYVLVSKGVAAATDLNSVLTIGNDAGAHKIENLADGSSAQDAVTIAQLAGWNLNNVLTSNNDANGHQIKNITDASDPQDVVSLSQMATAIAAIIQHFRGTFVNLAALSSAIPIAAAGDYAYVDAGVASPVQIYIWDANDATWRLGSSTATPAWTTSTAGVVEESTQSEAEAVPTAVAAASTAGLGQTRTPSEVGLYYLLTKFLTLAWTWALKQTFTTSIRLSSTTINQHLRVDASKDVVSVPSASVSDTNTGTDDVNPVTAFGLQGSKYETQYGLRTFVNGTSGTNAYTGNLSPAITTYGSGGLKISIKFTNANTSTTVTTALNGLSALPLIRPDGSPLLIGDIPAGSTKMCIYDGTSLIVLNPSITMDKSVTVSNSATGSTAIDCLLCQKIKVTYNTVVTGAITITKSNDGNLEFLNLSMAITGSSIAITFPSDVRMDRIFEGGVWNQSTKVLTVSAVGTADLFEFSLAKNGSVFILRYGGPARA